MIYLSVYTKKYCENNYILRLYVVVKNTSRCIDKRLLRVTVNVINMEVGGGNMLRVMRIIGIIIFACLVGLSANSLYEMYETGQLLDAYNSSRRSSLTLLGFSILALGVLGYFERKCVRKIMTRGIGFGRTRYDSEKEDVVYEQDTTSIYAAPKTMDVWQGHRMNSLKPRNKKQKVAMTSVWMGILQICSVVFPLLYSGLLVRSLMKVDPENGLWWLFPSLFLALLIFSIFTGFGLMTKRAWGMQQGYLLAIFNLLIFPFGTAFGLFLLMGLVGSTELFAIPARERRRQAQNKASKKATAAI